MTHISYKKSYLKEIWPHEDITSSIHSYNEEGYMILFFNKQILKLYAREMAQYVIVIAIEAWVLEFKSSISMQEAVYGVPVIPVLWGTKAPGSSDAACQPSSRFHEGPWLKGLRWRLIE